MLGKLSVMQHVLVHTLLEQTLGYPNGLVRSLEYLCPYLGAVGAVQHHTALSI